jgi:site-specific recombinase XerD
VPEHITAGELEKYLVHKLEQGASKSVFKHTVCSLRQYYRFAGLKWMEAALPRMPRVQSLPQVLNREECKRLFKSPSTLKHRVLLSLIYSAGLRSSEALNLRLEDIDPHRRMIHVRRAKYRKDRYVPLSLHVWRGLQEYYQAYHPVGYCFNGCKPGEPMCTTSAGWIMLEAVKKAGITKHATLHTLRHSYATHLLEMGINIRQLMGLMGHSDINSTMIYLHLTNPVPVQAFSPFDHLYGNEKK